MKKSKPPKNNYYFSVDMEMRLSVKIEASSLKQAEKKMEKMFEDEILKHEIIDVPSINYRHEPALNTHI